ncbi:MAG: 3-dehydroquinate dehydratase [Bacteroidia bacterium]|nr:3-dehydroquinate dehydratase [Bacteroidia bacterium]
MKVVHIINGPNLNLLGTREPEIYGSLTFEDYLGTLRARFSQIKIEYFQTNHEGSIIDYLQKVGFENIGVILNAGGYTHTSIAIRDTIAAITAPVIEVHISDIHRREAFRKHSYLTEMCIGFISGQGLEGYSLAIEELLDL